MQAALPALSGDSTHLYKLMCSSLSDDFNFHHFQNGNERSDETKVRNIFRLFSSYISFTEFDVTIRPSFILLNRAI